MRIIGAESRGILGTSDLVPSINRIADQISDLRVGWEVDSMKSRMIEFGVDPERLYWAPIPSSFKPVPKPNSPKRITLGFLGSARRNKGFSSIPNIAYSLNHSEIKLFVQQANFAWDGYSETLQELLGQGDRISFLPGAASNEELRLALSECSVLVLPYLADSYRFAGSGIMYQAANLGIPIICTEGVGFDWDVKNFGIGSTFRTLEDLHELIINFDSFSYFQNIIEYNCARNLACTEFLR
jgi:glycosyltransferase involved in cell wall biosynthesis